MRLILATAVLGLATFTADSRVVDGTDAPPTDQKDPEPSDTAMPFNIPVKTIGGAQVWTDYRFRDGSRLQKNSLTGHWRVLDASDVRRAWGTHQQCLQSIDESNPACAVGDSPHYVVLLHGLMRTGRSMLPLRKKVQ